MLNSIGFDLWADGYDRAVGLADESGEYPFAGYKSILNRICQLVLEYGHPDLLDLGFGTAVLTSKLYEKGCKVWGQDFSERMIDIATAKMPDARLFKGDLAKGLCQPLCERQYDAIIATYSLHHLDLGGKCTLIGSLFPLLKECGHILIGDVAFENEAAMTACRNSVGQGWDEEEFYFIFDEMRAFFPQITFEQHSHCAGVFVLPKP